MARNPDDLKFPEQFIDKNKMDVLQKLPPPAGKERAAWNAELATGAYYANVKVYANGRRVVEWYKYGEGGGPGNPDPISATSEDIVPDVKAEWDKGEEKQTSEAGKQKRRTFTGTDPQTGRPATVTEYEDGSFTYDEIKPSASSKDSDWHTEGTPDGQGGFDNSRPIMVRTVNGVRETRQPTAKELEDWNLAGQMTRNPGGKTDAQLAQEAKDAETRSRQQAQDARAEADRNKPGPVILKPDGKGGSIALQTMPDGSIKTTPFPNIPSDATRVTVDGVVYEKGPDGQFAPAQGIPLPGATSKNVEPFVPDPSQPDLGIGAWASAQRKKIGTPGDAGGITEKEYNDAATAAHEQARVYIQNVTSSQGVRRQAELDERSQRNDLSNQAAADYGRAQGMFGQMWRYFDPNQNVSGIIPAMVAQQGRARAEREATARPAPPLHPMFQQMPAAAGVAPAEPAAPAPVETPPNAIGLGAIGDQPAPTGGLPAPIFRPQPMAAPAPVPAPTPVRDDWNQPQANAPGLVSAWAQPVLAPPAPVVSAQPVLALQPQRPVPAFDPLDTAGRLANMGIPASAVSQALMELGLS